MKLLNDREFIVAIVMSILMLLAGLTLGEISTNKQMATFFSPTISVCGFYMFMGYMFKRETAKAKNMVISISDDNEMVLKTDSREKTIRYGLGCLSGVLVASGAFAGMVGPPPRIGLMHFLYFSALSAGFIALFNSYIQVQNLYCTLLKAQLKDRSSEEKRPQI